MGFYTLVRQAFELYAAVYVRSSLVIDSGDSDHRHFGNQITESGLTDLGEPADVAHAVVVA